ncbi:MAG: hypothetical protein WCT04_09960 [Planctomycetota bacterium]
MMNVIDQKFTSGRSLTCTIVGLIALVCFAATMHSASAKEAKRKKDKNGANDEIQWHDSVPDALEWAKKNNKPVMLLVWRHKADIEAKKMFAWQALGDASEVMFAAVRGAPGSATIRPLVQLSGIKSTPCILWLDAYGNPVKQQPIPDSVNAIADVIRSWPTLIAGIQNSLKDKVSRGEKLIAKGNLHDAYVELSSLAAYKGPIAESALKAKNKVTEQWTHLAEMADKQPLDSAMRKNIISGLTRETKDTDFESAMQKLLAVGAKPEASATVAVADADKPKSSEAVPPEKPVTPMSPEKNNPPAVAVNEDQLDVNAKGKTLADISAAPAKLPASSESGLKLNLDPLTSDANPKMKDAAKLLQSGIEAYRQATADSMDRGTRRNDLLKSAYENFNKGSTLVQEAIDQKPDRTLESILQDVSMMMYGCLKYQSL